MKKTLITAQFIFLLGFICLGHADEWETPVNDTLSIMTVQVQLTSEQIKAVQPILEKYEVERQELYQKFSNLSRSDKQIFENLMEELTEKEDKELSQILTPEQMDQWVSYREAQKTIRRKTSSDFDEGWDPNRSRLNGKGVGMAF